MVKEKKLLISSSAFKHNERIPDKFTCEGEDVSPPLEIKEIPKTAKSLVLIVDDPDASGRTWDHWLVWNISTKGIIEEGKVPGIQGVNSAGMRDWHGPCPPRGTHRYFFKVFALDTMLNLVNFTGKVKVEEAMKGHILAKGTLIGKYEMPKEKKQN
ncbi:MAG: YbhB/YbcL family Raf kinase inhibitor-like protein [archaeon]